MPIGSIVPPWDITLSVDRRSRQDVEFGLTTGALDSVFNASNGFWGFGQASPSVQWDFFQPAPDSSKGVMVLRTSVGSLVHIGLLNEEFIFKSPADSFARIRFDTTPAIEFGGGAVAPDARIHRAGTSLMVHDDNGVNRTLVVDAANRRVGFPAIDNIFVPSFPLHAEYQGNALWVIDVYGASFENFEFTGRKAEGTKAAPSALVDDDDMWEFSARGYDGVAFSDQQAAILFEAAGAWSALSHGTRQVFKTTPQGSTTQFEVLVLGDDGCVVVTGQTNGLVGAVAGERLRVEGAIRQNVSSATAFRLLDGSGNDRVVYKTAAPAFFGFSNAPGTFTPSFFMHGESEGPDPVGFFIDTYGAGNTGQMQWRKARGTKAAPTALLAGDLMGVWGVRGHDGGGFSGASDASMRMTANQNFAPGAHGTRISFNTTADGSASSSERWRIEAAGNWRMMGNLDILPDVDNQGRVGTPANRFSLVRAVTITAGDLAFENGWRVTEDYEDEGLRFVDRIGREIFAVRKSGVYFMGKRIALEIAA